ncbi:MAG: DUF4190 domain-containing protein [Anaerolineaceae bacterium]|nr:DUF4190 domain-containing protein [Anaerolineaceae bacterium]
MNERLSGLRPSTHGLAIISLVLSILGLLPILPVVGSIGGIVTGIIARKEIRARRDLYVGEGTAKAGIILGWIGIGLVVLAGLSLLLFLMPVHSTITTGPAMVVTAQP